MDSLHKQSPVILPGKYSPFLIRVLTKEIASIQFKRLPVSLNSCRTITGPDLMGLPQKVFKVCRIYPA